jgi:hypothetical protein
MREPTLEELFHAFYDESAEAVAHESDSPHPIAPPTAASATTRHGRPRRVWWRAYRHHLRLMRNQAMAWIAVIAGVGAARRGRLQDVYQTRGRAGGGRPASRASRPSRRCSVAPSRWPPLEGFVLWRWGGFAVLLAAVWGMFSGARLLRGAEEAGHLEPLRAGAISPRAPGAAALGALFTVVPARRGRRADPHGRGDGRCDGVGAGRGVGLPRRRVRARLGPCCSVRVRPAPRHGHHRRRPRRSDRPSGPRRRYRHPGLALGGDSLRVGQLSPRGRRSPPRGVLGVRRIGVVLTALTLVFARRDLHGGQLGQVERSRPDAPSVGATWASLPDWFGDRWSCGVPSSP